MTHLIITGSAMEDEADFSLVKSDGTVVGIANVDYDTNGFTGMKSIETAITNFANAVDIPIVRRLDDDPQPDPSEDALLLRVAEAVRLEMAIDIGKFIVYGQTTGIDIPSIIAKAKNTFKETL